MLAKLVPTLPEGEQWAYELKLDGYRTLCVKSGSAVHLFSRNRNSFTERYSQLLPRLKAVRCESAVIDGEIVAHDEKGMPSFQALQHGSEKSKRLVFYAFDLLNVDGRDTTSLPLTERKGMLEEILKGSGVLFSQELQGSAKVVLEAVRAHGLEGVVAKRKGSVYESGKRSGAWQKVRANLEQEFVIGGFVPGLGTFESLLVGYYDSKQLMFAGKVRAGYTPLIRREIFAKLRPLVKDGCPFANLPETKRSRWGEGLNAEDMRKCVWVKPVIVAQIAFLEWTRSSHLRHSRFIALRDDKPAREVKKESNSHDERT